MDAQEFILTNPITSSFAGEPYMHLQFLRESYHQIDIR